MWEQKLERLRNREPTEEIRRSCRSSSQFLRAIEVYNQELGRKAEETRRERLEEQERLLERKAENTRVLAEKKLLQKEVTSLWEERRLNFNPKPNLKPVLPHTPYMHTRVYSVTHSVT